MGELGNLIKQAIYFSSNTLMVLIPIVMAVFAFRLWRATGIRGSFELALGLGVVGVLRIISQLVMALIRRIVERDSAYPAWFETYIWIYTFLILGAWLLVVVGFMRLVAHLMATFPRATQTDAAGAD